jgi:hypothetical protein
MNASRAGHRGAAGLVMQAGGNPAKVTEPGASPREHRVQQPRHGEHVLAVRNRREDVLSYPLTVNGDRDPGGRRRQARRASHTRTRRLQREPDPLRRPGRLSLLEQLATLRGPLDRRDQISLAFCTGLTR